MIVIPSHTIVSLVEVIKLHRDFFNSKWDSEIIFHIYWKMYFYRSKIIM